MAAIFDTIKEMEEMIGVLQANAEHLHGISITKQKGESRKIFDQKTEDGTRKFGFEWLKSNERALVIAHEYGLNPERLEVQAFLTSLVFALLNVPLERKFTFPDGSFFWVRQEPTCPFALYSTDGIMANECRQEIGLELNFQEACGFVSSRCGLAHLSQIVEPLTIAEK